VLRNLKIRLRLVTIKLEGNKSRHTWLRMWFTWDMTQQLLQTIWKDKKVSKNFD